MKRLVLAFVVFLFTVTSVSADTKLPAVGQPYSDLSGKQRVIELQTWWTEFGHIHGALVLPVGDKVKGELVIPVRVALHNNPSVLDSIELRMRSGNDDNPIALDSRKDLNLECPYHGTGNRECSWSWDLRVNTSKYPDGIKQMILHVNTTTPDGKEFFPSSRIPLEFDNGNKSNGNSLPDNNKSKSVGCLANSVLGRGWYGKPLEKYSDAHALCLPNKPVSGIWNQWFVGDDDIKHVQICLSCSHVIEPVARWLGKSTSVGRVLFDKDGSFTKPFKLPIDTRLLENGVHSLSVRTTRPETAVSKCDYCTGVKSSLSGVVKYWFEVKN